MQGRGRRRSNTGSSAQHAQDNLEDAAEEAAHAAHAQALAADQAAAQALANAGQEDVDAQLQADAQAAAALVAAQNVEEQEDPVAKRNSLVALVNAKHIDIERKKQISKGLLILQSKTTPFDIEEMLLRNDILQLNLTDEEKNELLEEFLKNPAYDDSANKSLRFVDEIVRLKPPLNAKKAEDLQSWSDKYPNERTPISRLLDKEAVKLLNVLIITKRVSLGLSEYEATNWYQDWAHPELADVITRLYTENSEKFKNIDEAVGNFKFNLDSKEFNILNTAAEQAKITELHALVNLFPSAVTSNPITQLRLFKKLEKMFHKDNIYRKEMEIIFTEHKEQFPAKSVDDWIACFAHVRNIAREAALVSQKFGFTKDTYDKGRIDKKDRDDANPNSHWQKDPSRRRQDATVLTHQEKWYNRCTKMYDRKNNCGRCGSWNHKKEKCDNKNPDCNEDGGDFKSSTKGRQWWENKKIGPFVHRSLNLLGQPYGGREPAEEQHNKCEYSQMFLTSITQDVLNLKSPKLDYKNNSDFLTMTISLPLFQTAQPVEEGGIAGTRKRPRATQETKTGRTTGNSKDNFPVQVLLDSGCLIGDCISQEVVNKLNARHLIVHTNTTICSGFNNECNDNFPSLIINLSYINENNKLLESFETLVFILPKTPIDLIIGRKTLKQQRFSKTVPSHFEDRTNLTESIDMTTEDFVDNISQETYGATTLDQLKSKGTPFKAHAHLTTETHTCASNLKSDDNNVDFKALTGKEKSVKQDELSEKEHPLCLRNKYLSRGSCNDGGSCPCSLQQAQVTKWM